MSRTQRFMRGAFLSAASVLFSMLAMLAVGKMVTNAPALGKTEVGVFMLLLLGADFLNIANNFGLWVALPKLVGAAAPAEQCSIIRASFGCQTVVSLALAAALLLTWRLFPGLEALATNPDWRAMFPYLWLLPPLFLAGTLRDNAMAALAGLNRYGTRALGIAASSFLQATLVFSLVWWGGAGLVTLSLCMFGAYGTAFLLMHASLPFGRAPSLDWATYGKCVRFSLPLYANSLLNFFFQRFDSLMVAAYLGLEQAAVYEIAKRFPMLLSRTLGTLQVPLLPSISELIAQDRREAAARLLNQALILSVFFGYLGVLFIVTIQEPLVGLLFNIDYLGAASVMGLLMTAICLAVQAGLMGLTLIALERPGLVTRTNALMAIIAVALNAVLLPKLGIAGGGISLLAAAAFSATMQTGHVRRLGIAVDLAMAVKMHVIMVTAASLAILGGTPVWRGLAMVFFVGLSFSFGAPHPRELLSLVRTILPSRRTREA